MKVYVEISDALAEAASGVQGNVHEILDKQFDNVWVKQGMRVFESAVEHLENEQIAEHVEVRSEDGEELAPDDIADILDSNNVIWQ